MENSVQTLTDNFNTSLCLPMAIHIFLKQAEIGSNFVFSPASFHFMLSLIVVGCKGSTLEKLLSSLGSKNLQDLHSLASQIVNSVLFTSKDSKDLAAGPIVSFVNGAWVDQSFSLKPSFLEVAEGIYRATCKEVDFENKVNQVTEEINLWVEKETEGLITNLLPRLGPDTALILANALYFRGAWDQEFDAQRTEYKDFHLINGQIVQAPFMTGKRYEEHFYRSFEGFKVVKLPYKRGQDMRQFSMYFFLPDATDGLRDLLEVFKTNPEILTKQFEFQKEKLPNFWIPRFKFSFQVEASGMLKELGLELPFMDVGEITEMADSQQSLVLSEMFHKACIEVNEEGTEAAASTGRRIIRMSRRLNPPSFVADHPFMFIIREETSGILFFLGAVLNPLSDS